MYVGGWGVYVYLHDITHDFAGVVETKVSGRGITIALKSCMPYITSLCRTLSPPPLIPSTFGVLQIFHPNVTPEGQICHLLIGMDTKWSPQTMVIYIRSHFGVLYI